MAGLLELWKERGWIAALVMLALITGLGWFGKHEYDKNAMLTLSLNQAKAQEIENLNEYNSILAAMNKKGEDDATRQTFEDNAQNAVTAARPKSLPMDSGLSDALRSVYAYNASKTASQHTH